MRHIKKKTRERKEINAGSMADIAFLLLIFFLVATSINADKGIMVKLPPYADDIPPIVLVDRNVLSIKINLHNDLLVEGEPAELSDLRQMTKTFISNPDGRDDMPRSPQYAIVSLQNDRGTEYEAYIAVYNEIKGAYHELWDDASQRLFQKDYDDLEKREKSEIQMDYPLIISEAEPMDVAAGQ